MTRARVEASDDRTYSAEERDLDRTMKVATSARTHHQEACMSSRNWTEKLPHLKSMVLAAPRVRVVGGPIEALGVGREQTSLSFELGWRGRRDGGVGVLARGGYHLESTQIDRCSSVALPSEHLQGPTAGLSLDAPGVAGIVDLRLDLDALLRANRDQTAGLREGTRAPTLGAFARGAARYRATASCGVEVAYGFSQTRTELTGTGERLPDVDHASRTTTSHAVTLAATYLID